MSRLSAANRMQAQLTSIKANELAAATALLTVLASRFDEALAYGFGVTSAGFWFISSRFQRVAIDPPRDDRTAVEIYAPLERALVSEDTSLASLPNDLVELARALEFVVRSLERIAPDDAAVASQLSALGANSSAASAILGRLADQRDVINVEYRRVLPSLQRAAATRERHFAPLLLERLGQRINSIPLDDARDAAVQVLSRLAADELMPPELVPDQLLDDTWIASVEGAGRMFNRVARRPTGWFTASTRRAFQDASDNIERVAASRGPAPYYLLERLATLSQSLREAVALIDEILNRPRR